MKGILTMENIKDIIFGGANFILGLATKYIFSETTKHEKDIAILQTENKNTNECLKEIKEDLKFIRNKMEGL